MKNIDYLIVGQGIAGSLLAFELLSRGFKIKIIDNFFKSSSSIIAAGILNPITGGRLVKSWELERFLPVAKLYYKQLEVELNASFFNEREILRLFVDDNEIAQYHKRKIDEVYDPYLGDYLNAGIYSNILRDQRGSFIIKQAASLDMKKLLLKLRNFFKNMDVLEEDDFNYSDFIFREKYNTVAYRDILCKKIIFCEGFKVIENPWFKNLGWKPAKGEILTLKIEESLPDKIINSGKWLMPMKSGFYKAGASYDWDDINNDVTRLGREEIVSSLRKDILVTNQFEIVEQEAGVRPSTKDFKPYVGLHSIYDCLGIFNGFGSKGGLMVPYYAKQFADFLEKGLFIDRAVSPDRSVLKEV